MTRSKAPPEYIIYGLIDLRTLEIRYIGQSSSGLTRPNHHRTPYSLRPNTPKNHWLRELFASGFDYDVVVLETTADPKAPGKLCWWWTGRNTTTLHDLERWYIAMGRASGWSLTNLTDGGEGTTGWAHSEESKAKIGSANRGRVKSEATLKRMSASATGKKQPPETRARMSASGVRRHVLQPLSQEARDKIGAATSVALRGRRLPKARCEQISAQLRISNPSHRPEVRAKISTTLMGHTVSQATRDRISATLTREGRPYRPNPMHRPEVKAKRSASSKGKALPKATLEASQRPEVRARGASTRRLKNMVRKAMRQIGLYLP